MDARVVIALSGGVDSALAAVLLREAGYEVIGITMRLWESAQCGVQSRKSCCTIDGIDAARGVAATLGIPYYVVDYHAEFDRHVVRYFLGEYLAGRTPNPCVWCNQALKFGRLLQKARELGASHIATGHYAQVTYDGEHGRYLLRQARDRKQDQSYFLFLLGQKELARVLFPLGGYSKKQVRDLSRHYGLTVHDRPSSQDACFILQKHAADLFAGQVRERDLTDGEIVDESGMVLGRHRGYPYYTVGQRKGLGVAYREPLYVLAIDPRENRLVVGPKNRTLQRVCRIEQLHWIVPPSGQTIHAAVKIRYAHPKAPALLSITGPAEGTLTFDDPQQSITPGQAAVLYDDEVVLGGGWIGTVKG